MCLETKTKTKIKYENLLTALFDLFLFSWEIIFKIKSYQFCWQLTYHVPVKEYRRSLHSKENHPKRRITKKTKANMFLQSWIQGDV